MFGEGFTYDDNSTISSVAYTRTECADFITINFREELLEAEQAETT